MILHAVGVATWWNIQNGCSRGRAKRAPLLVILYYQHWLPANLPKGMTIHHQDINFIYQASTIQHANRHLDQKNTEYDIIWLCYCYHNNIINTVGNFQGRKLDKFCGLGATCKSFSANAHFLQSIKVFSPAIILWYLCIGRGASQWHYLTIINGMLVFPS